MVLQKKYKATLALSVSVIGTLAVLPMVGSGFLWDLLEAAFLASTVGGLADWFAVTAIFRKPLGISYRTDILRRNRTRIMQALVDYAANDLLSAANIMAVARKIDMAQMFVAYLEERGGRERIKDISFAVLLRAAETMDAVHVAERIWPAIRESFKSFPLEKFLLRFFDMLAEEMNSARILHVALRAVRRTLHDAKMQEVLLENIRELRERYERQASLRATVIQAMDLSDERLREIAVRHMDAYISSMLKGEGEAYERLAAEFRSLLHSLGKNDSLKQAIAKWKETSFERIDLSEQFALWLERNAKGKQARQYFIDCEKRLSGSMKIDFNDPLQAAKAFIEAETARRDAERKLLIAGGALTRLGAAKGSQCLRESAKLLKWKQTPFIDWLLARKMLFRDAGRQLCVYQEYLGRGWFEYRTDEKNGHAFKQVMVTPLGLQKLAQKLEIKEAV